MVRAEEQGLLAIHQVQCNRHPKLVVADMKMKMLLAVVELDHNQQNIVADIELDMLRMHRCSQEWHKDLRDLSAAEVEVKRVSSSGSIALSVDLHFDFLSVWRGIDQETVIFHADLGGVRSFPWISCGCDPANEESVHATVFSLVHHSVVVDCTLFHKSVFLGSCFLIYVPETLSAYFELQEIDGYEMVVTFVTFFLVKMFFPFELNQRNRFPRPADQASGRCLRPQASCPKAE